MPKGSWGPHLGREVADILDELVFVLDLAGGMEYLIV